MLETVAVLRALDAIGGSAVKVGTPKFVSIIRGSSLLVVLGA